MTQMRCALSVLRFDFLQKQPQRRLVGGVPRQHFVGERKALWGNDQRDDDGHAVGSFIAAVAVAALVIVIAWRIGREIGEGQILEQHLKLGAEQILPALLQVIEQRCLVGKHLVQAAI